MTARLHQTMQRLSLRRWTTPAAEILVVRVAVRCLTICGVPLSWSCRWCRRHLLIRVVEETSVCASACAPISRCRARPLSTVDATQHRISRTTCCRADPAVDEVMETASLLAEQFLPEATAPLLDSIGDVLDDQALMLALETLGEALGLEIETGSP